MHTHVPYTYVHIHEHIHTHVPYKMAVPVYVYKYTRAYSDVHIFTCAIPIKKKKKVIEKGEQKGK